MRRLSIALLLSFACGDSEFRIVQGNSVSVTPDVALSAADGPTGDCQGSNHIIDVVVYDSEGIPKPNTAVTVTAGTGAFIIDGLIRMVEEDSTEPADGTCATYYDAYTNQWYEFSAETTLESATDSYGQVRLYIWIDGFPPDGDDTRSISIYVSMATGGQEFVFEPAD